MAQAASKTCEICVAGPGLHYCNQCGQFFCDGCKKSHLRAKSNKNHTFLSGQNINPEVKIHCEEHSERLRFECMQCSCLVCADCIIDKHNGHKLVKIQDSITSLQSEVSTLVHAKLDTLQADVDKIKNGTETYKRDVEAVIKTIKAEGNAIKNMVNRKVESLIKKLKDKEAADSAILTKLEKEFSDSLKTIKKYKQKLDNIQETDGEVAVLQKLKGLKVEADKINSRQIPQFPSVKHTQKTVTDSQIEQLFGNLSLL